jgi:hypothetical protein
MSSRRGGVMDISFVGKIAIHRAPDWFESLF